MSANLQPKDFLHFIVETFNIKSQSQLTAMNISNKMQSLSDPIVFIRFAEENIASTKYQYLTGYQKFLTMFNDFVKESLKLQPKAEGKIVKFVVNLKQKLTDIANELQYQLQVKPYGIECYLKTYDKNLTDKEIEVCKEIGNWEDVYKLSINSPSKLEDELMKICYQKAMLKINPNIAIERKSKPVQIGKIGLSNLVGRA